MASHPFVSVDEEDLHTDFFLKSKSLHSGKTRLTSINDLEESFEFETQPSFFYIQLN
jgi:hypothetical protein